MFPVSNARPSIARLASDSSTDSCRVPAFVCSVSSPAPSSSPPPRPFSSHPAFAESPSVAHSLSVALAAHGAPSMGPTSAGAANGCAAPTLSGNASIFAPAAGDPSECQTFLASCTASNPLAFGFGWTRAMTVNLPSLPVAAAAAAADAPWDVPSGADAESSVTFLASSAGMCTAGAGGGSAMERPTSACAACRVADPGVPGVDAPRGVPGVPGGPPGAPPTFPTASGPSHTASATQSPAPRLARVMSCCDMSTWTWTPIPAATGILTSRVTRVASSHGACASSPVQPGKGSDSYGGTSEEDSRANPPSPPPERGVPGSDPPGEPSPGRPSRPSRDGV